MKRLFSGALLVLVLLPALAMGQSPFDGTWTIDMSTAKFPEKPDVFVLQNGMYECQTCVPAIKVKADGSDQSVTGHPYFDAMTVKAVDDHNIESTIKRNGKLVGTEKDVISQRRHAKRKLHSQARCQRASWVAPDFRVMAHRKSAGIRIRRDLYLQVEW